MAEADEYLFNYAFDSISSYLDEWHRTVPNRRRFVDVLRQFATELRGAGKLQNLDMTNGHGMLRLSGRGDGPWLEIGLSTTHFGRIELSTPADGGNTLKKETVECDAEHFIEYCEQFVNRLFDEHAQEGRG